MPNRTEFLQEARTLLDKSIALRDEEDDQEDVILRQRLREGEDNPEFLDADGEYPVRTLSFESPEEKFFSDFCQRNALYVNLCAFCRKCEFSMGDALTLSSSSLTIKQGQTKRFVSLRRQYRYFSEKYAAGRYLLSDALNPERKKDYLYRNFFAEIQEEKVETHPGYYQLASAYLGAWSLWKLAADFITLFWGSESAAGMADLFYKDREIRGTWGECKSPSLHAVFDLYADCTTGRDRRLFHLSEKLKDENYESVPWETLKKESAYLYSRMNLVLQYLGIMHERNEIAPRHWDFPRPLYNFVTIK